MVMPESPIQRPTIYDVARQAGVSKSLVSLVLQGSSRVSAGRRAAVLAAIDDLGYRPSRAATLLASHRTKSVEVVIDDFRNLSFVGLVTGIQSALSADGYHLTVTDRRLNAHLAEQGAGSLLSTNLDGLIIAGEPDVELLRGWEGPTVVAGWRTALPDGADLVANDDELGGRMAADHLLGLGHRTIGHLTGTSGPAAHRREGFTSRLAEAGLTPRGWATPDNQIARLRQSVARTVRDLHSPRATRPKHLTTEAMSPFQGAFEARRDPAQSRQARRTRNAATPGWRCDGHHRSMRTASRLTRWSRPSGVPPRRDSSPRRPDQP